MLDASPQTRPGFRHEAFFYTGEKEFVVGAVRFLEDAVRVGEPALVVVSARKIDLLRERLKADADHILFADMVAVGTNPARIIPAWNDFVSQHLGRRVRGIGEPIWAERSPAEIVECQHHEALLNVAFSAVDGFTLMCPYDTATLGRSVVDEARRSHPWVHGVGAQRHSEEYLGKENRPGPWSEPLPAPPPSAINLEFQVGTLAGLRAFVSTAAMENGLPAGRTADAVTAVNEVASNSLRYGGGRGVVRIWTSADNFICEVTDQGHIDEPLVGRLRPGNEATGGRGLWIVNQLCELVQVRSSTAGTAVRMHIRRAPE